MPDIMSFDEALKQTDAKDRRLLIGNGFSIRYFNYKTLLDTAGLTPNDPLRALFRALNTFDFEVVVRALEDASIVEKSYENDNQAKTFSHDAIRLREALVQAVRGTHPAHREDIADVISYCSKFLKRFSNIFTLNYDLLLYWATLNDTDTFRDGFGLGKQENGFIGPFKLEANCNIFNIHGGLHLFKTHLGEMQKQLMGATGVIDAIAETITKSKRMPIYVAEGTCAAKLAKINSISYLRHCFQTLSTGAGYFFVYGHSAAVNDAHVYRALFTSKIEHLYFFIHKPSAKLNEIDGALARYKRLWNSKIDYSFVDAESAHVWSASGHEKK
jgi:hypothetical protein